MPHEHPDGHRASRGELHGVADEVVHHLLQPIRVDVHRQGSALEGRHQRQVFSSGLGAVHVEGGVDQLVEPNRLLLEPHRAGVVPSHLEQIVDEVRQQSAGAEHEVEAVRNSCARVTEKLEANDLHAIDLGLGTGASADGFRDFAKRAVDRLALVSERLAKIPVRQSGRDRESAPSLARSP